VKPCVENKLNSPLRGNLGVGGIGIGRAARQNTNQSGKRSDEDLVLDQLEQVGGKDSGSGEGMLQGGRARVSRREDASQVSSRARAHTE
jgi:hypothetical protein